MKPKLLGKQLRATILKALPGREGYGLRMPAYRYHGMLVYFSVYKGHIGFYPTPSGIRRFKNELSVYEVQRLRSIPAR